MLSLHVSLALLLSTLLTAPQPAKGSLAQEVHKLTEAINRRDLNALKAEVSPSRIYVEIADKPGAYLTSSQTVVVMESFMQNRTSLNSSFEFVTDDGERGSASGQLAARYDGRPVTYRLNFGFLKNDQGKWQLTKISMK